MGIESGSFINDLDISWPLAGDDVSEGDNHLRLIKTVVKASFPGVDRASEYIYVHSSAPTVSVNKGRLWLDTSTTPNLLKIYDGSNFKKLPISATIDYKLMGNDTVGWVLPTADGTANYPLTTTGSNVLAFAQIDTTAIANNAVDGTKIAMGSDAAGDVLYNNGTDYVRLAKGTASQHLAMNSGVTAPEWVTPRLLGMGHNYRSGYTDVASTSMTDSGLAITYTKVNASSDLYVDVATEARLSSGWDTQTTQTGFIRLVYSTSTTTGIVPSTDDNANYLKENGNEISTGTVQFGFGVGYHWKITGLAAAEYTFKLQGRVAYEDGSIEFNDGTIKIMEVLI